MLIAINTVQEKKNDRVNFINEPTRKFDQKTSYR